MNCRHLASSLYLKSNASDPQSDKLVVGTRQAYEYFRYGEWELQTQPEREQMATNLRFETSHTKRGEVRSLSDYVRDMSDEQTEIFYIGAYDRVVSERSPYREALSKRGAEVLYIHPNDEFMLINLAQFHNKTLVCAETAPDVTPVSPNLVKVLRSPLPYSHWSAAYRFLWMGKSITVNWMRTLYGLPPVMWMFAKEVVAQMRIDFKEYKIKRKEKKLARKEEKKKPRVKFLERE